MIWKKLSAAFGRLENASLALEDGLNLIHASNESGKSTWCAFLRIMLYGFPPRTRGAEKNRYAPWSGTPMGGSMEIEDNGTRLTLIRRTARANSPMGTFSAVYTGTATAVEGLTGADCGEELLGVPREVFERSAFIRQAGLAIDQDAELERRIAALITTGEEDTSFSATYERLKKLLNARRSSRSTGQLPQLEGEIAQLEEKLRQAQALEREIAEREASLPEKERQEQQLSAALEQAQADRIRSDERRAQAEARRVWMCAREQLEQQRRAVGELAAETSLLPSRERLIELRSAAGSITVNELSRRQLAGQLAQRRQEEAAAEEALAPYGIFSGLSGSQAAQKARQDREAWEKARAAGSRRLVFLGAAVLLLGIAAASLALWRSIPAASLAGAGALACLAAALLCRKKHVQSSALAAPYGARTAEDFEALARRYTALYEAWCGCRQEAEDAARRLEDLADNLAQAQAKLLLEVRAFAPEAEELPGVSAAVDQALGRLRALEEAQAALDRQAARCDALAAALPPEQEPSPLPDSPDPESLRTQLAQARQEAAALRQTLAACRGQVKSLGDAAELQSQLEEKQSLREKLQAEYDALVLAMEALSRANADLQNRFSPALGEKAANIFTKLTGGKYNKVLLSRELSASVQESGSAVPRDALLLSQGAADQLYLAVRLAICDMVLPKEKAIPLVLDDALTSFDDTRCAAALDYLMELSRERQILLFTCQEREGAYLRRAYPGAFHDVSLS